MRLVYPLARLAFARPMVRGMEIALAGAEHLPDGAAVLACNPACDADPAVLMCALPRPVGFLAAPFMGRLPVFRTLLRLSGSLALGAARPLPWREQVRALLRRGGALVVFPEGQAWLRAQRFDAPMAPFHPGFAAFAHEARVPVVPLVIERLAFEVVPFVTSPIVRRLAGDPPELTETKRVLRYRRCAVHVLPPIPPTRFADRPKAEAVPWLVAETRARMAAALGEPAAASGGGAFA